MSSIVVAGDTSGSVTLSAPAVAGSTVLTLPSVSGSVLTDQSSLNYTGFKNRIINGAMVIDQRNAGTSVTPTVDGTYTVDRWAARLTVASKYSVQQQITTNFPFANYLGINSLSAYAVLVGDNFALQHRIEGFNVSDLAWGSASASAVTLSFRVYSSLTGTFGGSVANGAANRCYVFSYSIPVANTWTTISVTIPGDTTGTWIINNGVGLILNLGLGVGATYSGTAGSWGSTYYASATGAVSVVGTNAAFFFITGVQLEKGSTATSFDYRPYGTELALCYRYFYKTNQGNTQQVGGLTGTFRATNIADGIATFPVTMRAAPTTARGGTSDTFYVSGLSATAAYSGLAPTISTDMMFAELTITGGTIGLNVTYNGQQSFSAEL